ncbi:poly-beta-1,6-N-acetyl-D-glucosamine biosynthesis protein PgaD [Cupriavidus sp. AU9028]|uniref:poly-beta-1,6-N-acetyl-D-glucosamine biosynthesis protein PgaD n=1 Tax=Cupriavidus sp. AU9028 TaxID=2871157 RepID=UPI001C943FE6|nr:poly-beta-1,6-N-acetyl-D-glucosamine biosynthesis protein PgaD [Cupriavidus sp. AU9028]MBY4895432.1 poly-beta-1,6-N-acetyl-D-glucosamine biosynthesis protein PgaD [Cupriavidus sp. AU9028]
MNPQDLIIHSRRSRPGWLLDALLTALAWLGFVYLCVTGLAAVLRHAEVRGPGVPFWEAMLPTMGTLTVYAVVAAINGVVLLAWARYNQHRFSGMDRRRPLPALRQDELADSFALSPQRLQELQRAKVAIVAHREDGAIAQVQLA